MSSEIIFNAYVPQIPCLWCFIEKQNAEDWRNQRSDKDDLQIIQYPASSDKLKDLKNVYCVLPNDDVLDKYLT